MNIDDVKALPESLNNEELNSYFNKVLSYANSIDNINTSDAVEILEILCALADKQWHTYKLVDETIKLNIETFIKKTLNLKSIEYVDYTTTIIAYLGLEDSYKILEDSLILNLDESVRKIIIDFVLEIRNSIKNPYNGM